MSETKTGHVSGERERVLNAIRAAMSTPTNPHVRHSPITPDRTTYAAGLPAVGGSVEERLTTFSTRCEALKARLIVVDDATAVADAVHDAIAAEPDGGIAWQRTPLLASVVDRLDPNRLRMCVDDGFDGATLETCAVGVSGCFALIAQTGSVLVTSASTGGRSLSVLPPHHVVVATLDQLLPDLPSAFRAFRERGGDASMLSFISGPSRTGDIERILVLGAHGPKRLTIVLLKGSPGDGR